MTKIGIIGGAFNPVHYGHLFIASQANEQFELDKVIFVPCNQPVHKSGERLADGKDRCRMIRFAIESNPDFDVSPVELERGGKSYSVETVEEFKKKYGEGTEIYFIIGMDSFTELSTWKDIDVLLDGCRFIVATRPGWNEEGKMRTGCHLMSIPGFGISSTDIRDRIRDSRSVKYLLPEDVEKYIVEHGLYK